MWDHLKEIALVGTDKRDVSLEMFPEVIQQALQSNDTSATFLDALSLSSFYISAGTQPMSFQEEIEVFESNDTREYASIELEFFLRTLMVSDLYFKKELFQQVIDYLVKHNLALRDVSIIPLLVFSSSMSKEVRKAVQQLMGEKGQWLAKFDQSISLRIETTVNVWEEGTSKERKDFLQQVLLQDATEGLKLLEQTWQQESIAVKKSFLLLLNELDITPFIPFLEDLFICEFAWKPKEKKTEKECRAIVASLLLGHEDTDLFRATVPFLEGYILNSPKAKRLSFSKKKDRGIQLPLQEDSFFAKDNMLMRYGLDTTYDIALFENDVLYWFSELLSSLPFSWWHQQLGAKEDALVNAFLKDEQFKTTINAKRQCILNDALIKAFHKPHNQAFAIHFLNSSFLKEHHELTKYLSMEEFEQWIKQHKRFATHDALHHSPKGIWSKSFSDEVIKHAMLEGIKGRYHVLENMAKACFDHLHDASIDVLEKCQLNFIDKPYVQSWEKYFYTPIKTYIQLENITK